ncbi:grxC glutaredoxin 3 (plasmid) [Legionella adelaidensis]|uniref:Glutaredoxin n=1 Tax=Legionella adelaidensis TaxID=45056 RepID=A0A0W0R397_9GAMM|nr:glutaredoxin 3 [Legionella adelaidensis]KTC65551.1 glutaredoxin [Legionella adelaidensis]VEH84628.1 grxC glutaredoxin 3 [Legionella adelaidensis]
MAEVIIYSSGFCPYCVRAKQLLDRKGVTYTEIRVDEDPVKREEMIQKTNRFTVPQIFINGQAIGGCDDMYALERSGRLDELLRG